MRNDLKLLVGIALLPGLLWASPAEDLMIKLKEIKTFDAAFAQNITDEKGKKLSESEGTLQVKRPGRFYWKSSFPDELLVVADGKVIWTYDIELEQIVKQDQANSLGQSPAALLAGEVVDLGKEYDIVLVEPRECQKGVVDCFKLVPKSKDGQFRVIKIGFEKDKLKMIYMQDALDQKIETQFSNIKLNQALNDTLFDFTPPPGVDVIQGNYE